MAHLSTLPTFTFWQDLGENGMEEAIKVSYYNNGVELSQGDHSILIDSSKVKELFKEVLKHEPEARKWLDRK